MPASQPLATHIHRLVSPERQDIVVTANEALPTSLSFRSRDSFLIPEKQWMARRGTHLQLLDVVGESGLELRGMTTRVAGAVLVFAKAVRRGNVVVDERGLEAIDKPSPKGPDRSSAEERLHQTLLSRFGAVEFPRLMMEIDAQARFSTALLRRIPASSSEVMALYGALLPHITGFRLLMAMLTQYPAECTDRQMDKSRLRRIQYPFSEASGASFWRNTRPLGDAAVY